MARAPSHDEISRVQLPDEHLIEVAKCVMAWGQLEGHLRALLTGIEGKPLTTGAKDHYSLSPDDAWKKIKRAMRRQGLTNEEVSVVQSLRRHGRIYYPTRKTIVHCGCVGVWSEDPEYIAFAAFEHFSDSELALYFIPLEEIRRSAAYAKDAARFAYELLKVLGH